MSHDGRMGTRFFLGMLLAIGLLFAAAPAEAATREQVCGFDLRNDGIDNDGNDVVDDLGEGSINTCTDGINNDPAFDLLIDAADVSDCGFEYCCQDGIDNDGDGLTDTLDGDCDCLDTAFGSAQNCTANDVEIVLVGYGTPSDPCINPGDQTTIQLQAQVGSQGGNTRYDVQLWFGLAGDAKTGATCARQVLTPVVTAGTPSDTDLNNGLGPFRDEDSGIDTCGDIKGNDDVAPAQGALGQPDAVYDIPLSITLACSDVGISADGFLDIPTCFSYEQSADTGCIDPSGALGGTTSKCRCIPASNTEVSVPNINCGSNFVANAVTTDDYDDGEITCVEQVGDGDGSFDPGETVRCTVTYQNDTVCTPDLSIDADRRCGTGSYYRFYVTPDVTTRGDFTGATAGANDSVTVAADEIIWEPVPPAAFTGGVAGIISPNGNSEQLTFDYVVDPDAFGVQNVTFSMQTYWSFTDDFADEELQQGLACSATITTTPVSLAHFRAADGVVEWTTATETANAGFNVYGHGDEGWVRLHDGVIPSQVVSSTSPQTYRLEVGGDYDRYRIEDVDLRGFVRQHGVFAASEDFGERPTPERIDWDRVRSDNEGRGVRRLGAAAKSRDQATPAGAPTAIALRVDRDGIYRVTYEALAAAGFDLAKWLSEDLALSVGGQGVPIRLVAGKKFGPGSWFEFWGEGLDTLYTDTNVYLLTAAKKTGLRMAVDATAAAGPAPAAYEETLTVERNRKYSVNAPGPDPWVDEVMLAIGPNQWIFPLVVDAPVGAGAATLHLTLGGVTDFDLAPDHHVRVQLNGVQVADVHFDGPAVHHVAAPVPPGLLVAGANTIKVLAPSDTGAAWDSMVLESYGVTYSRQPVARAGELVFTGAAPSWSVTGLTAGNGSVYRLDAGGPVHLAGATFGAAGGGFGATFPGGAAARFVVADASALRTPGIAAARPPADLLSGPAEYLVISHSAFTDGIADLVDVRRGQGWSADIVEVEDIFATYSGEVVDAHAIRRYIADAAARRGTEMVLLVGGDTFDYRDYAGGGSISFVPSLYAPTGNQIQWAPADPAYADLDGDGVQDLAIGRFPVRTAVELAYVVDKTLAYEDRLYGPSALLVADRFDGIAGLSFQGQGNQFLEGLIGGWSADKAYLDLSTVADARQRIFDSVNEGVALTGFFGHSGPTVWTFSSLFRSSDVASLTNEGSPTVVVQWGCWNTYYVEPSYNTLGHKWLVAGDHGAAAVLGATTLVDAGSARRLSRHLAPRISVVGRPLGLALLEAKQSLAVERKGLADVQLGWTLLGDPALTVRH